ncbi:MAG: hypothetical protein Q7R33_01365 [Nitrosarchaeum sp.]|nr:hypothetical protein [Nitrosarchaeum sp.]
MSKELIDYPMWHRLNNWTEIYNFILKIDSKDSIGYTISTFIGKNLETSKTKHLNAVNKFVWKELQQKASNFNFASCEYSDVKSLAGIVKKSAATFSIFEYKYCAALCDILRIPDKNSMPLIEMEVLNTFPGTRAGFLVATLHGVPLLSSQHLARDVGYCLNSEFMNIEIVQPTIIKNSHYETTLNLVCTNDLAQTKISFRNEVN